VGAITVALLVSMTLAGAFFAAQTFQRSGTGSVAVPVLGEPDDQPWTLDALAKGDLPAAPAAVASDRPVYRYSVVPGGTHSPDELRTAIRRDAVVAAHYERLDQSRLRMEVVPSDRYVHVSYRKGDRVLWTAKKVLLRKGETILTDGTTEIRTRCGNCISEQPAGPTSSEEPDSVEFDRLVDAQPAPGAPEAALIPGVTPWPQGLIAGGPSSSDPFTGSGARSEFGPALQGGAPIGGGAPGIGGGAPDPLVSASKSGRPEEGSKPGSPDGGSPGTPGDNDPPIDLPQPPGPPGTDDPFAPINPFAPETDNPFPPGPDNPFGDPEYPVLPPADNPPGSPENPTPVPEPGTLLLMGGGAAELIRRYRRRSAQR
jgi:hypothetical protein